MMPTGDSMYSNGICSSANLSTTNPHGMGSREILRSATNLLSQGTTQDLTNININYVSMNVKYGLQSDTCNADCTMIRNCRRPVVPTRLQVLPPSCEAEFFLQQDRSHAL
jgi:hypothetical protein